MFHNEWCFQDKDKSLTAFFKQKSYVHIIYLLCNTLHLFLTIKLFVGVDQNHNNTFCEVVTHLAFFPCYSFKFFVSLLPLILTFMESLNFCVCLEGVCGVLVIIPISHHEVANTKRHNFKKGKRGMKKTIKVKKINTNKRLKAMDSILQERKILLQKYAE